jgi:hypothetical protein
MGDVKKILSVSAAAIPSGKFVNDGSVEFSGIVSYDVLYSDSDGKLTKIQASSDYDMSQSLDMEKYNDSLADCRVVASSIRLSGPRKMTLRSSLVCSVRVSESEDVSCTGDALDMGDMLETAAKSISIEKALFGSSPEREYAEEASKIASVSPDDIEIIGTSGAVRIIESVPAEDGVTVRGELIITSIIRTEEQPPFAIKKTVPFEENISLEGVRAGMKVMADGYLTSVTTGVAEDSDGSSVTVNAICEFSCIAGANEDLSVNTDAYLKNRDTECEYEDFSYSELVCMANCDGTVSYDVLRSEIGCASVREILTLSSDVKAMDKHLSSDKIIISGDMAVYGVACEINEDNTINYIPVKFNFPFETNVNIGCQLPDDSVIECYVSCVDTDSALDSDTLSVKCALKIGYRASKKANIRRLKSCVCSGDAEYSGAKSCITVYYPEENETLFGIAKRYHTSIAKIAADNNLSESVASMSDTINSLSGVKRLIIR